MIKAHPKALSSVEDGLHNYVSGEYKFNATRPEALLATKHLYRTARWMRCVEAMCATYFIIGPHHTMVNDFGHTQAKMMARAL